MMRFSRSFLRGAAVAAATFLSLGAAAEATVLKWTLNGAISQANDPITGSFLFDTTTNAFSDINLVSPATSPSGGLTFDAFLSEVAGSGLIFGQFGADPNGIQSALFLDGVFLANLGTAGVLTVNPGSLRRFAEFSCPDLAACEVRSGSSFSNWVGNGEGTLTGEVVSDAAVIPVPAALPLAASAFALMGLIGLRRRARG